MEEISEVCDGRYSVCVAWNRRKSTKYRAWEEAATAVTEGVGAGLSVV